LALVGYVDGLSRHAVVGWVADTEHPNRPVDIAICVNGHEIVRLPADRPREDLKRLGNFGLGNHGFYFAFNGASLKLTPCQIEIKYAETGALLPNGQILLSEPVPQTIPFESSRSNLTPLLLTGHARSGSTIFMKRLADHPQMVVAKIHPYEFKLLNYYSSAYKVLTSHADGDADAAHPFGRIDNNSNLLGVNPFFGVSYLRAFSDPDDMYGYVDGSLADILKRAFGGIIDGLYETIAKGQHKASCLYYVEKNDIFGDTRTIARHMFPALKEIILIRDLRDVFCSYRDFFNASSIPSLQECADLLLAIHKRRETDVLFVRYEDFIDADAQTMTAVARTLNIQAFPTLSDNAKAQTFEGHGTSASPQSSIGRWRNELSAEEQQVFAGRFAEFFKTFGYDLA
jgi:hypothetical protein